MAQSIIGWAILLLIIAAIVLGYLAARAAQQIGRGFRADPKNKLLRIALAVFLICLLLAVLTNTPVVFAATGIAFVLLLASARAVELSNDELFQEPGSKELFVHDVLHEWWKEVA